LPVDYVTKNPLRNFRLSQRWYWSFRSSGKTRYDVGEYLPRFYEDLSVFIFRSPSWIVSIWRWKN